LARTAGSGKEGKSVKKVLLIFCGVLLLGGIWGVPRAYSQASEIIPVINFKGQVAWDRVEATDREVYLHPGFGPALNLTVNLTEDFHTQINDRGQVVRVGNEEGTPEVYLHQPTGEVINISQNNLLDAFPQINKRGDVVWQAAGSDNEIWYRQAMAFEAVPLTDNSYEDVAPQINDLGYMVLTCPPKTSPHVKLE